MTNAHLQEEIFQLETLIYTTIWAISEIDQAINLYRRLPSNKKNSEILSQIKIQRLTIINYLEAIETYCLKLHEIATK